MEVEAHRGMDMLDYVAIFDKLNKEKIKYIVAGGMAVNFYGIPRMTYDIDLLIALKDKNLKRFLGLMKEWNFKPRIPVDIMDFAKKDKRLEWIKSKHMKAFNLFNPEWAISEIDIIIDTPIDYEKAKKRVKRIFVWGISIPTVSIDDLIIMKRASGREQDKSDIRYLRRMKNEKK